MCSEQFTPVCFHQHVDAAYGFILAVGVLKPFHKVRVLTQLCAHRREEGEPHFFLSAVFFFFTSSLQSKFPVIQPLQVSFKIIVLSSSNNFFSPCASDFHSVNFAFSF